MVIAALLYPALSCSLILLNSLLHFASQNWLSSSCNIYLFAALNFPFNDCCINSLPASNALSGLWYSSSAFLHENNDKKATINKQYFMYFFVAGKVSDKKI